MEVETGSEGAVERKLSRLHLAGGAFFPSVQPSTVQAQEPEAAVSHSEGFHSCTGRELCVIQKLSKTMAIPLCKIYFFRLSY